MKSKPKASPSQPSPNQSVSPTAPKHTASNQPAPSDPVGGDAGFCVPPLGISPTATTPQPRPQRRAADANAAEATKVWEAQWAANNVVDRRTGLLRRSDLDEPGPLARPAQPTDSYDRRRGAGRRLSDFHRQAEEGDFTTEQFLFVMAIENFKKSNGKTFPSWTDVLEVIRLLGYRKTMPSELQLRNAEDWREASDGPSNVRPKGWERRAA